jgi:hypothetical protein
MEDNEKIGPYLDDNVMFELLEEFIPNKNNKTELETEKVLI